MTDSLLCIEVTLRRPHPPLEEAIEEAMWQLGALGVERQDDSTFSALVEDPRPRPAGSVRWRTFMPTPDDIDATRAPWSELLGEVADVDAWILDDLSFLTTWKEFFRPAVVSPRILVHPPWDRPAPPAGGIAVEIEPGMAFGTGTHETTRLCLAALDRLITSPGARVLDVGCGSGVLAIAAAKLGAEAVEATDVDPDAVRIANENFTINGVDIVADTTGLSPERGTFDIVVANILPHVLIELRDALVAHARPGGTIVLSGIIDGKEREVRDAFETAGTSHARSDRDGEWWSVEVVRR